MKNFYLLIILISILNTAYTQVTGDNPVCEGDQANYSVPIVAGATYSWDVTGGSVISGATSDNADILWGSPGTGTIIVEVLPGVGSPIYHTLNVTVNPSPTPVIASEPYASCPPDTSRNQGTIPGEDPTVCEKVCKGATIAYSTELNAGSSYSWIVDGESAISGAATNEVTVTWDNSDFGSLVLIETNSFGCTDSTELCIEKVDVPVASFNSQASVCKFSNVWLENTSTGASEYFWDFGDGFTSEAFEPNHSYSAGGTYTITLIAQNECFCADTIQRTVVVDTMAGPEISCPSTICANDTMEYTANGDTSCTFNWFAIGGDIVSGDGTPTVSVAWGPGQIGTLGLYLSGCTDVCMDTTFIEVPIVPEEGLISGESVVCAGDCETYSLPYFSGATYKWSLSSGCGELQDSTCCESVQICWSDFLYSCTDTLNVSYYDSFLNCGGSAQFVIDLRPKFSISGFSPACANETYTYGTSINSYWSISPSGPVLSAGPSTSVTIDWNDMPDDYVLTAIPVDPSETCTDSAKFLIQVNEPPLPPLIDGDTLICPEGTNVYCAPGSGANVNWIITGGSPATATNNCVTVNWDASGPYLVQAYETSEDAPFCESDTSTFNVESATGVTPVMSGPSIVCANGTDNFFTTTTYPPGATYTWTVNPSIDGSVLSPGSPATDIEWGNNAPGNVWVALFVEVCGTIYADSVNVTLNPIPEPVVTQLNPLCEGGTADLSASGGVSYSWSGPGGYTSATNPTTISEEGLYFVSVTDANGCLGKGQLKVTNVSGPDASISSPDFLRYCIGSTYSVDICALGNPDYTYLWSDASTSQCINTTSPGSFNVTVTDAATGCVSISDPITVSEVNCNPSPCQANGSISFTHTGCNPVSFTNTSSVGAINFAWFFGDGNTSGATNPTHTYDNAGFYLVQLFGDVPNAGGTGYCTLSDSAVVEIPLSAKFDLVFGCDGEAVCFTDMSTYTAGNSISSWSWDFGDGNTSTLEDPCHTYSSAGTYTVELTIANATCSVSYSETFTIDPSPTASFNFPDSSCVNVSVPFTDASFTSIYNWSWEFGDGGTSLNQNPNHTYSPADDYTVSLFVSDIYGCVDTLNDTISIVEPGSGDITAYPDTVVCEGTSVVLVAPTCAGCSYLWNTGSTNDSLVVNSTGIYTVEVDDGSGCPYSTFKRIIVNSAPTAFIRNSGPDEMCFGDAISISASYNPNWDYEWLTNDGVNNGSVSSSIFYFPVASGTYTYQLIVSDVNTGCTDTSDVLSIVIHDNPADPSISPIGSGVACEGESIALVGSHPDPTVDLVWSTGEITDTIFVTGNGCYKLIATDTNGCSSNTRYCVTINPLPDICSYYVGCFDTCAPYTIIGPAGGTTYQWFMDGSAIGGATDKDYTANVSGLYSVAVTNDYGCSDTTDELELNLYDCGDTLCAELLIDSIFCDSQGNYILSYQVVNQGDDTVARVNLDIISPLGFLYGPAAIYENILPGDTSSTFTTTIFDGEAGDVVCFRTHLDEIDHFGTCCSSDTVCVVLPPCDTNCCRFDYVSDSIWCEQTSVGPKYFFDILVDGCGTAYVSSSSPGILNVSSPYTLTDDYTISGSYVATNGEDEFCLTFQVMDELQQFCKDTTICYTVVCEEHPRPCEWDFKPYVCVGQEAFFNFYGSTAGFIFDWTFTGGTPSTASGPGSHSVTYDTPGTYPVTLTMTNSAGVTRCVDSITVLEGPTASIVEGTGGLYAYPAGMTYQWYNGSPWSLLFGENNQFLSTSKDGYYCVVVTDEYGCADTACIEYQHVGVGELDAAETWGIYPNPSSGSFSVEVDAVKSETVQFRILNTLGKVVDQRSFDLNIGTQHFFIDNDKLLPGVYFVELKTDESSSVKRLLID